MYKIIQIAEVLYRSRLQEDVNILDVNSYKNESLRWRDIVTLRLSGKRSTSSANYQHDLWNNTAMPPQMLLVLDAENKRVPGIVERYIYQRYIERCSIVTTAISIIEAAKPEEFYLQALIDVFIR